MSETIHDTVLGAIGNTPVVRLNRIGKESPGELLVKLEFMNPGGSVKDRIAAKMIEDAEASGRIKPGDTLIEPTSGNTGVGLAMAAAAKGYKMIITMPLKMSEEKRRVLRALGAELYLTPTEAPYDSPESHIGVAERLEKELPNAHILDQYSNPSNPSAHVDGTAAEIYEQVGGKLDVFVAGIGTGGTITGVARALKERIPGLKVVGADPAGSIFSGGDLHSYHVEGIGYDFFPEVYDRDLVDEVVQVSDKDSFVTARRLIREEGILAGGSSGSVMWAALQAAKDMQPGQRLLAIMADSSRNYISKLLNDEWMAEQGYLE